MRRALETDEGVARNISGGIGVRSMRGAQHAAERRCAAAFRALAAMTGDQRLAVDDESIEFLAHETSEQLLHEIVKRWAALQMGYPTPLRLAALAETIHLEKAVSALDR
jgi:hypothetical protein